MFKVLIWSYITKMDGTNKRVKEPAYINPKYITRIYIMGDVFRLFFVDGGTLDCDESSVKPLLKLMEGAE